MNFEQRFHTVKEEINLIDQFNLIVISRLIRRKKTLIKTNLCLFIESFQQASIFFFRFESSNKAFAETNSDQHLNGYFLSSVATKMSDIVT